MDQAKARTAAIAALDEFERMHGKGLSAADRRLLERLRDEDNGEQLGEAWQQFRKYRENDDDDQRLIKSSSKHGICRLRRGQSSMRSMRMITFGCDVVPKN